MKIRPFCHPDHQLPALRLNCVYCWLSYIFTSKREQRDDICSNLATGYSSLIRNVQFPKFTKIILEQLLLKFHPKNAMGITENWQVTRVPRISSVSKPDYEKCTFPRQKGCFQPQCPVKSYMVFGHMDSCALSWCPVHIQDSFMSIQLPFYPFYVLISLFLYVLMELSVLENKPECLIKQLRIFG